MYELSYCCPICGAESITKYYDNVMRFRTCDNCIRNGCKMELFDVDIKTRTVMEPHASLSRIMWNIDDSRMRKRAVTGCDCIIINAKKYGIEADDSGNMYSTSSTSSTNDIQHAALPGRNIMNMNVNTNTKNNTRTIPQYYY